MQVRSILQIDGAVQYHNALTDIPQILTTFGFILAIKNMYYVDSFGSDMESIFCKFAHIQDRNALAVGKKIKFRIWCDLYLIPLT